MPKNRKFTLSFLFALFFAVIPAFAQQAATHPWSDTTLSPDVRADLVLKEMTLDEKIDLLHGNGMPGWPEKKLGPTLTWGSAALASSWVFHASAFPSFR